MDSRHFADNNLAMTCRMKSLELSITKGKGKNVDLDVIRKTGLGLGVEVGVGYWEESDIGTGRGCRLVVKTAFRFQSEALCPEGALSSRH